ncbi:hydroxyacyl-thioester dehydratase [Saccharomycopsis crataegensis]|uniref:Hydroxyacyl-thioester dehydratase n=1 Tax=Saccharomycopsis crataegensis TaxID=43959 RepID=A0AAV5QHN1_9ASCO|nr:hydroxyacyl-thioester dehydratase [Saccharomycopsis crataegensis]
MVGCRSTHHQIRGHTSLVSNFQINVKNKKWIIEDDLSATHAHYLYKTLNSLAPQLEDKSVFRKHTLSQDGNNEELCQMMPNEIIPLGYSFVYFNPSNDESILGVDGYDNHQAPVDPKKTEGSEELFKRRMWVGGHLVFNNENPLRFNQVATCIESVDKIKPAGNSVFVNIDRKFFNSTDMSMRESRTLIYTNDLFDLDKLKNTATVTSESKKYGTAEHQMTLKLTESFLFRYSALTFNAHKIHYDINYSTQVEKYPSILVQGPLTVTLLLQWFSHISPGSRVLKFSYKNKFPLFVTDSLTFKCNQVDDNQFNVWVENDNGVLCCDGKVVVE